MHKLNFESHNPTVASVHPLAFDSAPHNTILTNEAIIEHTKLKVFIKITIWIPHEPGQIWGGGGRGYAEFKRVSIIKQREGTLNTTSLCKDTHRRRGEERLKHQPP